MNAESQFCQMPRPPSGAEVNRSSWEALRRLQATRRYVFEPADFANFVGGSLSESAIRSRLIRLERRELIVSVVKRPAVWLVVPAEYCLIGAPPVSWWINELMMLVEPDYYVSLLSAARHWGSGPYDLCNTYVMVNKSRPELKAGELRVHFLGKKRLAQTPTVIEMGQGRSHWRVSTREATVLDMIQHQDQFRDIECVSRVVRDLAPDMTQHGVLKALDAMAHVSIAQRLGFLLEQLGFDRLAELVAGWLGHYRTKVVELSTSVATRNAEIVCDRRWNIRYDVSLLETLCVASERSW